MGIDRRLWILGSAGALGSAALASSRAAMLSGTPAQTRGPFYPDEAPLDADNDLVRVEGRPDVAAGEITHLSGTVLDHRGRVLADTVVEIWQCDAFGRYHHPRDRRDGRDPHFQGYGRTLTDPAGRYRFRTIRPVRYPGRAPHIHFAVRAAGGATLVTQLYVKGDPANEDDFLFTRLEPATARDKVAVAFEPDARDPGRLTARFDIVIPG